MKGKEGGGEGGRREKKEKRNKKEREKRMGLRDRKKEEWTNCEGAGQ